MKVVILCGGKGARMGEVNQEIPKPLMEIGGKPVLWHIMNRYGRQGYGEFVLLLGHLGHKIRDYFAGCPEAEWKIDMVDTGPDATKSERIAQVGHLIKEENFFLSYGDDLADINFFKLLKFHEYMDNIVTLTSVRLVSPFGVLEMDEEQRIIEFKEKPVLEQWMNGGFMVMSKRIFPYLRLGELEEEVFNRLVAERKIGAYKHKGMWKSMNTLKDYIDLNKLWDEGKAFWREKDGE